MGLFKLIGKLTGVEDKVKWSRSKKIEVIGPDFFGQYFVYVDFNFKVAMFLPKADKNVYVHIGNIVKAKKMIGYNHNGEKILDKTLSEDAFQWKINPKNILFRGTELPPNKLIYRGKVIYSEDFMEEINDNWIEIKAKEYINLMNSSGSLNLL